MRSSLFTIILLTFSIIQGISQTLKETEEWITQKFEEYEYVFRNEMPIYSNNGYSTKTFITRVTSYPDFSNQGELWISYNKFRSASGKTQTTLYIIPIKHMKSIKYEIEEDVVWVHFAVKNDNKNSRSDNIKVLEPNKTELDDSYIGFAIEFDKKFLQDDMPNRFKKAFDNLIKLNGGTVVKEAF